MPYEQAMQMIDDLSDACRLIMQAHYQAETYPAKATLLHATIFLRRQMLNLSPV